MRGKGLGPLLGAALATLLTACQSAPPEEEPATATRAEVALALRRQLHYVRERHETLRDDDSPEARAEKEELVRLAMEIALRILRIDPEADLGALSLMIEEEAALAGADGESAASP